VFAAVVLAHRDFAARSGTLPAGVFSTFFLLDLARPDGIWRVLATAPRLRRAPLRARKR
jgi:hypothetical protein